MLHSEGSRLDDPNQNMPWRMSAHHEDPSKTANRSWKEQQGKCLRQFLRYIVVGEKLILPSILIKLKLYPFEKFIVREIELCEKT